MSLSSILTSLSKDLDRLKVLLGLKQIQIMNQDELRLKLYDMAYDCLGRDLAPHNDMLGCAETVSTLIHMTYGENIKIEGTYELSTYLSNSPKWEKVDIPKPGDIIISPTGTNSNRRVVHGHTGVVGKFQIMSNNSNTGKLDTYWTLPKWRDYFNTYGGFPVYYFRRCA
jgi:hypothetical protein